MEKSRPLFSTRRGAPVSPLARSNAAQCETHIRYRNRRRFDDAVAVSDVAAIRALATWSL